MIKKTSLLLMAVGLLCSHAAYPVYIRAMTWGKHALPYLCYDRAGAVVFYKSGYPWSRLHCQWRLFGDIYSRQGAAIWADDGGVPLFLRYDIHKPFPTNLYLTFHSGEMMHWVYRSLDPRFPFGFIFHKMHHKHDFDDGYMFFGTAGTSVENFYVSNWSYFGNPRPMVEAIQFMITRW